MTWYEAITVISEVYICVILTVEYFYDRAFNQHVKNMKRRTKKHLEFDKLTIGESK